MKKLILYTLYWILSLTWGAIMTSIGLIAAIVLLLTCHRPYRLGPNIYFKVGSDWGGLELGAFFIVDKTSSIDIAYHEAGHGLQNIIWGPLMPFIICIPSAVRYWYREYLVASGKKKYYELSDYDSIWFENDATKKGEKYYKK